MFGADAANAAQLASYGETVTITVGAVDNAGMQAIFLDPWKGQTQGGMQVERPQSEFQMRQSDWDGIGGAAGAVITRADASAYTVTDPVPDQGDWVRLKVRSNGG